MTSSIKPPGGTKVPDAAIGGEGSRDVAGSGFRSALERASQTPEPSAAGPTSGAERIDSAAGATRESPVSTPGELVDQLVARALDVAGSQGLNARGKAELEAKLRRMLVDDPTLAAGLRDMQSGDVQPGE